MFSHKITYPISMISIFIKLSLYKYTFLSQNIPFLKLASFKCWHFYDEMIIMIYIVDNKINK